MEFLHPFQILSLATAVFLLFILWRVLWSCWIFPNKTYNKLRSNGFGGPNPSFPLGNISDMRRKNTRNSSSPSSNIITHGIHSTVFPYFARWQKSHGKVFIYWLGTEPFLYIADPEFLKQMSAAVMGKSWGKPAVFKHDREPLFGNGLNMAEGEDWVRHRHIITPAFSPANLKAMASIMVESTTNMVDRWSALISSGNREIDVDREISSTAGEIIGKTSFGVWYKDGRPVFEKLRALQLTLFKSNRCVGVPFSKFMSVKHNSEARRLGKEFDSLLSSIIADRRKSDGGGDHPRHQKDLLGILLGEKSSVEGRPGTASLTNKELVDECKTFFFGGHETTALAVTWTLLLLGIHTEWQDQLREEIEQVVGNGAIEATTLAGLKKMGWVMNEVLRVYPTAPNAERQAKEDVRMGEVVIPNGTNTWVDIMGWVMNEVLRLYPTAPNAQRQAREDIRVGEVVIPNGTNMWVDIVGMHHDRALWGEDVNRFRPERFRDDQMHGGCKHKMGFLPFGFGGRMCVGRNLAVMEYKIFLTLILLRFSFSLSSGYRHSPSVLLSLRPLHGLPLVFQPL